LNASTFWLGFGGAKVALRSCEAAEEGRTTDPGEVYLTANNTRGKSNLPATVSMMLIWQV